MIRVLFKQNNRSLMNVLNQNQSMIAFNKRFDGSYPWFQSQAENIPRENPRIADDSLDETEVITRILFVLNQFHIYDLAKIEWEKHFDDQGMDSLEQTAILTSIEHEFHTVFEDRVFENFDSFRQVKEHLVMDHNAF